MLNARLSWPLFLGAYSPLFAILYALLATQDESIAALVALALAGLGLGAILAARLPARSARVVLFQVSDVLGRGGEYDEYFGTWALPLLAAVLPLDPETRTAILAGLLVALVALYPLRQRLPASPLLALTRRRALLVAADDRRPRILLADRAVERGEVLRVAESSGGLLTLEPATLPTHQAAPTERAASTAPASLVRPHPSVGSRPGGAADADKRAA